MSMRCSRAALLSPLVLVAGAMLPLGSAHAQSRERSTMINDDGQTRTVLHYAEPDFGYAFRPDYERADLPVFGRELSLDEGQRDLLSVMLDAYLTEFEAMLDQFRTEAEKAQAKAEREARHGGQAGNAGPGGPGRGGPGDAGPGGPSGARGPDEAQRAAIRGIVLDELRKEGFEANSFEELPFGPPSIGIRIGITDDGNGPQPDVGVSVSFGADDDSLTEATRRKLQAAADRIVPRLTDVVKERVMQDLARQREQGGADPGGDMAQRWADLEKSRDRFLAILAAKKALREKFERDAQALLRADQIDRWQPFVRVITRIKTLPLGTLDGERTDLLALLEETAPDATRDPGFETARTDYEHRLHDALVRRNELAESADILIDRALHTGRHREALSLTDRLVQARLEVRTLNDEFLTRFAALLPGSQGEQLQHAAIAASHPRILRPTVGDQAVERALALPDLTAEQRAAIDELGRQRRVELDPLNATLIARTRRLQAEEPRASLERVIASINGADPGGPPALADELREGFQQRQTIDARYVAQIRGLLTPEQVKHVPEVPRTDVATPVRADHEESMGRVGGG